MKYKIPFQLVHGDVMVVWDANMHANVMTVSEGGFYTVEGYIYRVARNGATVWQDGVWTERVDWMS